MPKHALRSFTMLHMTMDDSLPRVHLRDCVLPGDLVENDAGLHVLFGAVAFWVISALDEEVAHGELSLLGP